MNRPNTNKNDRAASNADIPADLHLYRLGAEKPIPPPRGSRGRGWMILACILMALLLTAVGSLALARSRAPAYMTEPVGDGTRPDGDYGPAPSLSLEGIVTVSGFGPLMGREPLTLLGEGIKSCFASAVPAGGECQCPRETEIHIGGVSYSYDRDHGCFEGWRDGAVRLMDKEGRAWMDKTLEELEQMPSQIDFFKVYDIIENIPLYDLRNTDVYDGTINEILSIIDRMEPTDTPSNSVGQYTLILGNEKYTTADEVLRDEATGDLYALVGADFPRLYKLLEDLCFCSPMGPLEIPTAQQMLHYTPARLYPGDVYTLYEMSEAGGFGPFRIKEIYLCYMGENADYRISLVSGARPNSPYAAAIPSDAPFGEYRIEAVLYPVRTEGTETYGIVSDEAVLTVLPHERATGYTFTCTPDGEAFTRGEFIRVVAGMRNDGDDIHRLTIYDRVYPDVTIRTVVNGREYRYWLQNMEDQDFVSSSKLLKSGEASEGTFMFMERDSSELPAGSYDVIVSFEGHETVFTNAFTLTDP